MEENKDEQSNKQTKKTYKTRKNVINISVKQLLALIAFIGIGFIAVSLLFTVIFKKDLEVSRIFNKIGEVIAYILCIALAFSWVKSHKSIPWIVLYVVFVVTIVVLYILNF